MIRCYITGKLRKDTSEERVRQEVVRALVEDYGYSVDDIAIEFPIKMGVSTKYVDIVIFEGPHEQENIFAIVEVKGRSRSKRRRRDGGFGQLKSYLSACLNAEYGVLVRGRTAKVLKVEIENGKRVFVEVDDLPSHQGFCLIVTACIEHAGLPYDCPELQIMRMFRDSYVIKRPDGVSLVKEYYKIAPTILQRIISSNEKDAKLIFMLDKIREVTAMIEAGDLSELTANVKKNFML